MMRIMRIGINVSEKIVYVNLPVNFQILRVDNWGSADSAIAYLHILADNKSDYKIFILHVYSDDDYIDEDFLSRLEYVGSWNSGVRFGIKHLFKYKEVITL